MYRKVMMQIYFLEGVYKNLYVKVYLEIITFQKRIAQKIFSKKGNKYVV